MSKPSPSESHRFTAGACRYAAEVFRGSPFAGQRAFAPTLDQWAARADRRADPEQPDLFTDLAA